MLQVSRDLMQHLFSEERFACFPLQLQKALWRASTPKVVFSLVDFCDFTNSFRDLEEATNGCISKAFTFSERETSFPFGEDDTRAPGLRTVLGFGLR